MQSSSRITKISSAAVKKVDLGLRVAGTKQSSRSSPARSEVHRFEQVSHGDLVGAVPVAEKAKNGVGWLPVRGWDFPWIWSGFSTRIGGTSRAYCGEDTSGELGEMNLGFTAADDRDAVTQNRRLLAEAVTGGKETPVVTLRQFHSNFIVPAAKADAARERPRKADGLITNEPGFLIAIQTADCIPILVADRKKRVVAAFHAGWRGTVKRIAERGVGRMRLEFGSRASDLVAAIGPGIGVCCYAVGEEVLSEFESQFAYARELFCEVYDADPVRKKYPMLFLNQRAPGHGSIGPQLHVDLIEANRRQLIAAGVSAKAIRIVGGCTQCHPELFFSHRGSHGHAGRMMAVIGIHE